MEKKGFKENETYVSPMMQIFAMSFEGILCESLPGLGHNDLMEDDDWELK